jgi:outer membrane protein assembly factor BamA
MNQLKIQLKANILLSRNNWYLQTDWRLYIFNLPTYGLGTGYDDVIAPIPGDERFANFHEQINMSYPMDFNWIKFHNVLTRRVIPDLFVGAGYHLDYHFNIQDKTLDTDAGRLTPHYSYSVNNGFNPEYYVTSGISLNVVYDSRDNLINPYKGIFAQASYRCNPAFLGSSQTSTVLWTEFRTYVGLSARSPRHLLAFWAYGNFLVSGKVPYLDLMATGFDQMNSSGRGYILGRWRGEDLIYGEMEYRFPISRCSDVVGGVLFANVTTASNYGMNVPLFKYMRAAAGFGVRIMLNKHDRTNLVIDLGIGGESTGLYIQAQEVF